MCLHCVGSGLMAMVSWFGFAKTMCNGVLQVGSSMTQPLVLPLQPQLGLPQSSMNQAFLLQQPQLQVSHDVMLLAVMGEHHRDNNILFD